MRIVSPMSSRSSEGGALQVLQARWLYQKIRDLSSGMAVKNYQRLFI